MHNDLWDVIYQYFSAQTKIYAKFTDLDFEQQLAFITVTDEPLEDPDIVSLKLLHAELCEILQLCKERIASQLDETSTQFIVSTLAITCDENVLTKQISKIHISQDSLDKFSRATAELKLTTSWPKLQRQFGQCIDGGERFFDNLELFLGQANTFKFLIELSYFCLGQGFCGKHINHLEAIQTYKDRCFAKLTEHSHFSATDNGERIQKTNKYGHVLRKKNEAPA